MDLVSTDAAEAVRHRSRDAGVRPLLPEEAALEMTDRGSETDGDIALFDAGAARAAPRWT